MVAGFRRLGIVLAVGDLQEGRQLLSNELPQDYSKGICRNLNRLKLKGYD